jgi:hypothetical protein
MAGFCEVQYLTFVFYYCIIIFVFYYIYTLDYKDEIPLTPGIFLCIKKMAENKPVCTGKLFFGGKGTSCVKLTTWYYSVLMLRMSSWCGADLYKILNFETSLTVSLSHHLPIRSRWMSVFCCIQSYHLQRTTYSASKS